MREKKKFHNPNLNHKGSLYGAFKTETGDWIIAAKNVNCYLLIGQTKAMLIDTAYGEGDLRAVVESITDLPIVIVNTHGHLDHSGGNAFWQEVFMGHGGEKPARALEKKKKKNFADPNFDILYLEDGQVFDLGDREVEAIAIGAHHGSSFAFLDHKNSTLYTGDEIESGQVLLFASGEAISERILVARHLENMQKLYKRRSEFNRLMPSHNGAPISVDYIEDYMELAKLIIKGEAKPENTIAGYGLSTLFGWGDKKLVRFRFGKASFIMSKKYI